MELKTSQCKIDISRPLGWLCDWAKSSEQWWYQLPDNPRRGCYGTGYNAWGVQTNQKYLSAMAVLATHPETPRNLDRQWALERALQALRFSLASHRVGPITCTDGTSWGHTWISSLGIERMFYAVYLLQPHLTDDDRLALYRVLISEADWIWQDHHRGAHHGVFGGRWKASGKNVPESNLWNGAMLWRTAAMYPDHPNAESWRRQAHRFLVNSVSIPADADDETILAGKPVREWFAGANFFDNFALDHHGYLNVGYMVICVSNAAMLHFDLKSQGLERPESLDHHQRDLWRTVRRMLFSNGRIARIGGDSRVRYCYCQEYLLPSLLYAADRLGETHAGALIEGVLDIIEGEFLWSGDGGFYSRRLDRLKADDPYYYTRLESDRACVLGQLITYLPQVDNGLQSASRKKFEADVGGVWHEPEHGAVMHRSATRLASMSWRAQTQTQAMCQPPDDAHLTDWAQNLTGKIEFAGAPGYTVAADHRRLAGYNIQVSDGGFVTCGHIYEGCCLTLTDGLNSDQGVADHRLALAALPDGHTLIGLQQVTVRDKRVFVHEIKGLHLNLINDFYNAGLRRLTTNTEELILHAPPHRDEVIALHSRHVNIEGRLGIVGLYGAETLHLHRSPTPRAGGNQKLSSLNVEEINWHCEVATRAAGPGEELLDVGWAVLSAASAERTRHWAELNADAGWNPDGIKALRAVVVRGMDDCRYLFAANFSDHNATVRSTESLGLNPAASTTVMAPGHARLWALEEI